MSSRRDPERLPGQDEREPISIGEDRRKNEEVRDLVKVRYVVSIWIMEV